MTIGLLALSGCRASMPSAHTAIRGRDSVRVEPVSRGIVRETHWLAEGPWVAQVVRVDLGRCGCRLDGVHAFDGIRGRETVSAMARRLGARGVPVLAAINADFFDLRTGDVENNQVIGGEWTKGTGVSESPHHTYPTVHAQVGQLSDGRVVIGRYRMRSRVLIERGRDGAVVRDSMRIDAINPQRRPKGSNVIYSWRYGGAIPVGTGRMQVDSTLAPAERDSMRLTGDSAAREVVEVALAPIASTPGRYRVLGRASSGPGGQKIPNGGIVLSIWRTESAFRVVSALREQDEIALEVAAIGLDGVALPPVRTLVGGWGELIIDGADRSALVDSLEGTFPRFSAARHPRSAVGLARGGRELLLAGVDGRGSNGSAGMSLVELGRWMKALGATSAANLDGGGSTTVWVTGAGVVNRPSDPTGERPVGNALFVIRK